MYYRDRVFSISEKLFDWVPESYLGAGTAIRALFSAQLWSFVFPDLKKFKTGSHIDFKCGFNKDFLITGNIDSHEISQIQLEDGNNIGLDLHFGCNLLVLEVEGREMTEWEALMELFKDFHVADQGSFW